MRWLCKESAEIANDLNKQTEAKSSHTHTSTQKLTHSHTCKYTVHEGGILYDLPLKKIHFSRFAT